MNNIDRLKMEIAGIKLTDEEMSVYLEENNLIVYDQYQPQYKINKRAIYQTALSILNSIANQPSMMKNYKQDDMTVSEFAKYLQNRIDQLESTIRQMPVDDNSDSNFFNLFQ